MSRPPTGTGGALPSSQVAKSATSFQNEQMTNWRETFKTFKMPAPNVGTPFNKEWLAGFTQANADRSNALLLKSDRAQQSLRTYYPYTYVIPEEERWKVQQAVGTVGDGVVPAFGALNQYMGKALLGEDFFQWQLDENKRQLGLEFEAFVINNMDISTLLKKEYWKKKMPEYYEKVMAGGRKCLFEELRMGKIFLEGPASESDWKFLYNKLVQQNELPSSRGGVQALPLPPTYNSYTDLPGQRAINERNANSQNLISLNVANTLQEEQGDAPYFYPDGSQLQNRYNRDFA